MIRHNIEYAANTHPAEAVLRISCGSSCISSAASHAGIVPGDAKNDVRVILLKNAAISSTDSATKAKASFVFCSNTTFAVKSIFFHILIISGGSTR
jgi:hypothetical protein